METFKEQALRILAEKQELGLIPKLTDEEQKRAEARIDAQAEKLRKVINEAGLSVADQLQKLVCFLEALNRKDYKTSSRALKRYWRRRELARKKGRRNQRRRKRFR